MAKVHDQRAWKTLQRQVISEEPVCQIRVPGICTEISTTGDHILPYSRWPELGLERSNVQGACSPCNRRKGKLTMDELREQLGLDDEPRPALDFFNS